MDKLRALKAEKAEQRKKLGSGDKTSNAMVDLMRELGQVNSEIGRASNEAMALQEKIDDSKLSAVHLEATMAETRERLREDQAMIQEEEAKSSQLKAEIEVTQRQLHERLDNIQQIKGRHDSYATAIDGGGGEGMYHGQEELAANCGKLETLMAVLPQLEADLQEAEGILRSRNATLIERTRERAFLQNALRFLQPKAGQGQQFRGVDPQLNFEQLDSEIAKIEKITKSVEEDARNRKKQEMMVLRKITETETEMKQLTLSITSLSKKLTDRSKMISEIKIEIQSIQQETAMLKTKIELKKEQLNRADQIEDWRLRQMLRRLDIQRQMRERYNAEAGKIALKAVQVEDDERQAVVAEAEAKEAEIEARCNVCMHLH